MQVPTEKRKLRKELKLLFICMSLFLPQFYIKGGTNAWTGDNQFSSSFVHLMPGITDTLNDKVGKT